jgi:hypothetical protein
VSTDLYTGRFHSVKVLSDDWYSTNLKDVIVGETSPIAGRIQGPIGMPSNSIIDSGTNSLNLSPQLLATMISKFPAPQQELLNAAIRGSQLIPAANLNLSDWPTITFVLEGDDGDVRLNVPRENYWQVDTQ